MGVRDRRCRGMYSSTYSSPGGIMSSYGPPPSSRYRDMVSSVYGGGANHTSGYSSKYSAQSSTYSPFSSYSTYSSRGETLPPMRGASLPPLPHDTRPRSPSIPRERTRDELIDSIVHTRTREHRAMPGFKSATDFDERRSLRVDCDKVFNGIIIGNGETVCNIT